MDAAERCADEADVFFAVRKQGGVWLKAQRFPSLNNSGPDLQGQDRDGGTQGGADESHILGMGVAFRLLHRVCGIDADAFVVKRAERRK